MVRFYPQIINRFNTDLSQEVTKVTIRMFCSQLPSTTAAAAAKNDVINNNKNDHSFVTNYWLHRCDTVSLLTDSMSDAAHDLHVKCRA